MTGRSRPGDGAAVPRVGGVEPFEEFFTREARRLLAVAEVVADTPARAERAVRDALAKAVRDWERVGSDPDPRTLVAGMVIARSWPRRRGRRSVAASEVPEPVTRLREALWGMRTRQAQRAARRVLAGEVPIDGADLLSRSPMERLSKDRTALGALAGAVGGVEPLASLAEEVRDWMSGVAAQARTIEHLRPAPRRSRAALRAIGAAAGSAAVVLGVLAVIRVVPPQPEEDEPPTTRTTRATSGSERIVIDERPWWWGGDLENQPDIAMDGWIGLDPLTAVSGGWVHSVVSTGDEVFIWMERGPPPFGGGNLIVGTADGGWRFAARLVTFEDCAPRWPTLIPLGDEIVVAGVDRCYGMSTGYVYAPRSDTWRQANPAFFEAVFPSALAWTGSLLVAPFDGMALDWETGEVLEVPVLPLFGMRESGRERAYWTGSRVIAAGLQGIWSWAPGGDEWLELDAAHREPERSAWTDEGLLVLNDEHGARFHDGDGWRDAPGVSWTGNCWAAVVQAATPTVQTCGGFLMWDAAWGRWVPMASPSLEWSYGVGVGDAFLAFGERVWRLDASRDDAGALQPTPTIPIGNLFLALPEGVGYVDHIVYRPAGTWPGARRSVTVLVEERASGHRCTIEVPSWPEEPSQGWLDAVDVGAEVSVERSGMLSALTGWWVTTDDGISGLALDQGPGSAAGMGQRTLVLCEGGDDALAHELAAALWSRADGMHSISAVGQGMLSLEFTDPETGLVERYDFEMPALPDRARSERAREQFRVCVQGFDDTIRLGWYQLLVDAEDGLLQLYFTTVVPGANPPVASIPDRVADECLAFAGVHMTHEYRRPWL